MSLAFAAGDEAERRRMAGARLLPTEEQLAAVKATPLPDSNPKTAAGALKTPVVSVIPASAILQMAEVMRLGKHKYGPYNWRDYPVTYSTYVDAAMRHLMQYWDGETVDPESGQSHLAHAAAGLAVLMDAIATGNATDDRPKPGAAAELISLFKKRREEAKG